MLLTTHQYICTLVSYRTCLELITSINREPITLAQASNKQLLQLLLWRPVHAQNSAIPGAVPPKIEDLSGAIPQKIDLSAVRPNRYT